jgi:hypothetical protein
MADYNTFKKWKANQRLVRAAEDIRIEKSRLEKNGRKKSAKTNNASPFLARKKVEIEERGPSDDRNILSFDQRKVSITVVGNAGVPSARSPPSKLKANQPQQHHLEKVEQQRSVRFHKYDEVFTANGKEYVYSQHTREEERENNFDIVDHFEEAARDVAYFFKCLKKELRKEAKNKLRKKPPAASTTKQSLLTFEEREKYIIDQPFGF